MDKLNEEFIYQKKDFVKLFESFLSTQKGDNKRILEKFKKTLEEIQ